MDMGEAELVVYQYTNLPTFYAHAKHILISTPHNQRLRANLCTSLALVTESQAQTRSHSVQDAVWEVINTTLDTVTVLATSSG